jgi:hypothetical protein
MQCTYEEDERPAQFNHPLRRPRHAGRERAGFELAAKLGFCWGAFKERWKPKGIKNLDALIAKAGLRKAAIAKTAMRLTRFDLVSIRLAVDCAHTGN